MKAYVSLSFADTGEALLTSNVTFCTPLPTPLDGQLGESFFGCQELLWAAWAAGAVRVDGPVVHRSAVWSAEWDAPR